METREDISIALAKASLGIGSISLKPQNPFTWASGYRMPIYNDNRMLLGSRDHRAFVTGGLLAIANDIYKDKTPDYILGTSTAGIAPAATLASITKRKLIILNEGKFYELRLNNNFGGWEKRYNVDIVASSAPWAIGLGIEAANHFNTPFIYLRDKKKEHGKQQQIEGIYKGAKKGLYFDIQKDIDQDLSKSRIDLLKSLGIEPNVRISPYDAFVKEVSVKGKEVLQIEDLFSFGGSAAKEAVEVRKQGGDIWSTISIFSYDFPEVRENFRRELGEAYKVDSILTYPTLLEVAKNEKYLTADQVELLKTWRDDPTAWGEKNGFPKVEKTK